MRKDWISVETRLPKCARSRNAYGTPVLIWPTNPMSHESDAVDGFCYYGKRATGSPEFYLYGTVIHGVEYWQPMPGGPK